VVNLDDKIYGCSTANEAGVLERIKTTQTSMQKSIPGPMGKLYDLMNPKP
jgi:hypothetical protein